MGTGPGQIVDDTDFSGISASGSTKPIGRLVASGTQALADNTDVAITFSVEDFDTHGFHSTSSNTSRVTPTVSGYYRFWGTVYFASQTTPVVSEARLRKNGSSNLAPAWRAVPSTVAFSASFTLQIDMNGTSDYIEMIGKQDSAGANNTNQSFQFSSVLEWERIRDL